MLEVGHDLRYLGERRCLRQVATVAVADVVGKDGIERLREGSSAMLTKGYRYHIPCSSTHRRSDGVEIRLQQTDKIAGRNLESGVR